MNIFFRRNFVNPILALLGFHPYLIDCYVSLPYAITKILMPRRFLYKVRFSQGITIRGTSFSETSPDPLLSFTLRLLSAFHSKDAHEEKEACLNLQLEVTKQSSLTSGSYLRDLGCSFTSSLPLWTQVWPWETTDESSKYSSYPTPY